MKALVTGANGFLGAHLVGALRAAGHPARALVREGQPAGELEALGAEIVRGDATDPAALRRAVAGCEVVFHLAGVRRAVRRDEFMRVNAGSTRLLLDACVEAAPSLSRFVLAGSLSASGPSRSGKREDDPFDPQEWYGESKAEAERIAFSHAARLPVAVARPPRIMGPGDRENLFFFKLVKRGVVVSITGAERPISFIDVDDCARGLLVLAQHPAAVGEAFFLASPERTTIEGLQREVARALGARPRTLRIPPAVLRAAGAASDAFTRLTGRRLPVNRKLAAQILSPGWTCDPSKARARLGFEATTPLADSIGRAARWYEARGWL